MSSWYKAVCDQHRELCTIFVAYRDRIETVFPDDAKAAAMQFLSDHWTCEPRLLRDDVGTWPKDYVDKTPP